MDNPEILIEGVLYRSSTSSISTLSCDSLPIIEETDTRPLERLLRAHKLKGLDQERGFWPFQLLLHILTRKRIQKQLKEDNKLEDIDKYLDYIRPETESPPGEWGKTYVKIFALLVLCSRGHEIGSFIKAKVCDEKLPIYLYDSLREGQSDLCCKDALDQPLNTFGEWKYCDMEWLQTSQWGVLVPFFEFARTEDNTYSAKHYELNKGAILPWVRIKPPSHITPQLRGSETSKKGSVLSSLKSRSGSLHEGGFAEVSCIRIDPLSHGFSDILKDVS